VDQGRKAPDEIDTDLYGGPVQGSGELDIVIIAAAFRDK